MTQPHTLYVFGTGNATMTRYYNTCFAIRSGEEYFMTDAGGGNGILRILEEMQDDLTEHILNNIAVSLDLSLEDDEDGFERIMAELRMREKYESNRGDRL